jgi:hypothetical protein
MEVVILQVFNKSSIVNLPKNDQPYSPYVCFRIRMSVPLISQSIDSPVMDGGVEKIGRQQ